MAINALNENGLLYFWQKIKNLFVQKETGKGLSTNDFTTALKNKLDGLSNYDLPTASADTKGGVKVGAGLAINNGVLSATGGGTADAVDWSNVQNKPAAYTPDTHSHAQSDITGLSDALAGKAASSHTHAQTDVTGLSDALAAKIASSEKGAANGVAELDSNGLIPVNRIPGAFEDVVDGYYDSTQNKFFADAQKTTELEKVVGRVYVDITSDPVQYRWGGSTFSAVATVVVPITNAQIDTIVAS